MKTKKLKIAIIIPTLIIKGGAQNQLMNFAMELNKLGHHCEIFTFAYYPQGTFPEFSNVKIYSAHKIGPKNFLLYLSKKFKFSLESLFLYMAFFQQDRFAKLLKNSNAHIINPHDWFSNWIAVRSKEYFLPDSKIVVMLNDMPPSFYSPNSMKGLLIRKIDRKISKSVNHILVLDNTMKKKAKSYYTSTPISTIRSGIDLTSYRSLRFDRNKVRKALGFDQKDTVIICASIPTPHRRFEDAIRAINLIKANSVKLLIVGDLNYNKQYGKLLQELVRKLSLGNRVKFISKFLPFKERAEIIASSDIFVFPNENQTWGLGVIEAQALGLPCIISDGAGVHEVMKHKINALIYEVRNVKKLHSSIMYLIANKKSHRTIANNGRVNVFRLYSWKKYTQRMILFFKKS